MSSSTSPALLSVKIFDNYTVRLIPNSGMEHSLVILCYLQQILFSQKGLTNNTKTQLLGRVKESTTRWIFIREREKKQWLHKCTQIRILTGSRDVTQLRNIHRNHHRKAFFSKPQSPYFSVWEVWICLADIISHRRYRREEDKGKGYDDCF